MSTAAPIRDPKSLVDYAKTLDCIHCGLCLHTCPTYRLTGAEPSSPRGRIHLMRSVAEGELAADADYAEELDFCLVCRHCESVCPAGVRFGEMMEHARGALQPALPRGALARAARRIGFDRVLPSRGALRLAGSLLGLAQRTGLVRAAALLPGALGARARALRTFPLVPPGPERRLLPPHTPAAGPPGSPPRGAALLLEGCVMPELYARVNRATAAALAALGLEVRTLRDAVCCGALHAHNGELAGARELARRTVVAVEEAPGPAGAPLVMNSAGCGAHLSALGHALADDDAWRERARAVAKRVVDFSVIALRLLRESGAGARLELPGPVAWDAPCHLCHGQGIRREPLELLDAIAGLRRVELEDAESCCGSAGIYSLLRPADSAAVLEPKLDALERSGARVLVTENPGCQLQWETGVRRRGLDVRVMHLAEVVAAALGRG